MLVPDPAEAKWHLGRLTVRAALGRCWFSPDIPSPQIPEMEAH